MEIVRGDQSDEERDFGPRRCDRAKCVGDRLEKFGRRTGESPKESTMGKRDEESPVGALVGRDTCERGSQWDTNVGGRASKSPIEAIRGSPRDGASAHCCSVRIQ